MTALRLVIPTLPAPPWLVYTANLASDLLGLPQPMVIVGADDGGRAEGPRIGYGVATLDQAPRIPRLPCAADGAMVGVDLDCLGLGRRSVLVLRDTIEAGSGRVDLLFNLFSYVSCLAEWEHERASGSRQSYACRVRGDAARYDRPWANYLLLALAEEIERAFPGSVDSSRKQARVYLTHDVDVLDKKLPTRAKDTARHLFNAARDLTRGRMGDAAGSLVQAWRMVVDDNDYFALRHIAAVEEARRVKSAFNVFTACRPSGFGEAWVSRLLDPTYDSGDDARLRPVLDDLVAGGWEVGSHFAFHSWRDPARMTAEIDGMRRRFGLERVRSCRQHWLRFSLGETWAAQTQAGIEVDTTLGFNDRPGFRAGLAAAFRPYDHQRQAAHEILAIPTMLMDTQLYYSRKMSTAARHERIATLLDQLIEVGGEACVIWHTHVFSPDHGWGQDYETLLDLIVAKGLATALPADVCSATGRR